MNCKVVNSEWSIVNDLRIEHLCDSWNQMTMVYQDFQNSS